MGMRPVAVIRKLAKRVLLKVSRNGSKQASIRGGKQQGPRMPADVVAQTARTFERCKKLMSQRRVPFDAQRIPLISGYGLYPVSLSDHFMHHDACAQGKYPDNHQKWSLRASDMG